MIDIEKFKSARFWMAICFTLTFCYLGIVDKVDPSELKDIVLVVISFYFGQSIAKDNQNNNLPPKI